MRLMGHHTVPVNYSKSDKISCRSPDFKNYEIKIGYFCQVTNITKNKIQQRLIGMLVGTTMGQNQFPALVLQNHKKLMRLMGHHTVPVSYSKAD